MPPDPSSDSRLRSSRAPPLYYPCYGTGKWVWAVTKNNLGDYHFLAYFPIAKSINSKIKGDVTKETFIIGTKPETRNIPEVSRLGSFINKRKRVTSLKVSRYVRIQGYTGILPDNSCNFFFGLRKKRWSLLSRDIVGSLSILLRFKVLLSYVSLSETTKPLPSCGLKMTILFTSKLI